MAQTTRSGAEVTVVAGLLAVGLALGGAAPAGAEPQPGPGEAPSRATEPDQELVAHVHEMNANVIRMARLAEARARRASVKDYAATLVRDHEAADQKLLAYARRKNFNMGDVAYPGDAMAHGPLAMTDLTAVGQSDFDYSFANKMVTDHQAAIDEVTEADHIARDPELRALLANTLTPLRQQLATARGLLTGMREPPSQAVQRPGQPSGVSRTHTGADERAGVTTTTAPGEAAKAPIPAPPAAAGAGTTR